MEQETSLSPLNVRQREIGKSLSDIQVGRSQRDQYALDPNLLYVIPEEKRQSAQILLVLGQLRAQEGVQQATQGWKDINQSLTDALDLPTNFSAIPPQKISESIDMMYQTDLHQKFQTRLFILKVISEQLQDAAISPIRATAITEQFFSDFEKETDQYNPTNIMNLSREEGQALFDSHVQALTILATVPESDATTLIERSKTSLMVLSQRNAWYLSETIEALQNPTEKGQAAADLRESITRDIDHIVEKLSATDSTVATLSSLYEPVALMIQTLGRTSQVAFENDNISEQAYMDSAYTIANATWKIVSKYSEESQLVDPHIADDMDTLRRYSGNALHGMTQIPPFNGNVSTFIDTLKTVSNNETVRDPAVLLGFAIFLKSGDFLNDGITSMLWEHFRLSSLHHSTTNPSNKLEE